MTPRQFTDAALQMAGEALDTESDSTRQLCQELVASSSFYSTALDVLSAGHEAPPITCLPQGPELRRYRRPSRHPLRHAGQWRTRAATARAVPPAATGWDGPMAPGRPDLRWASRDERPQRSALWASWPERACISATSPTSSACGGSGAHSGGSVAQAGVQCADESAHPKYERATRPRACCRPRPASRPPLPCDLHRAGGGITAAVFSLPEPEGPVRAHGRGLVAELRPVQAELQRLRLQCHVRRGRLNDLFQHPKQYTVDQMTTVHPDDQAAGRVFCSNTGGREYMVWTQNAGNMLGYVSGPVHGDVWNWWVPVHHNIGLGTGARPGWQQGRIRCTRPSRWVRRCWGRADLGGLVVDRRAACDDEDGVLRPDDRLVVRPRLCRSRCITR